MTKVDYYTQYFRDTEHTVNGLNAFILSSSAGSSENNLLFTSDEDLDFGFKIMQRDSFGTETELVSGVQEIFTALSTDEYTKKTKNVEMPQVSLNATDALVFRLYYKTTLSTTWTESSYGIWITSQFGETKVFPSSNWEFTFYSEVNSYSHFLMFGSETYDSNVKIPLYHYYTTGSDELPAILFVEGKKASVDYNVPVRGGGPCPICRGPVSITLYFNPTDSYYYFNCPICGVWLRWCDYNGTMESEFEPIVSQKTTETDEEMDPITVWTGTF